MVLIKKDSRRAIQKAEEIIIKINSRISALKEKDLEDDSVQDSVKNDVCDFIAIIKENRLEHLLKEIKGCDCLLDCCNNGFDEEISFSLLCLQTYIPIIKDAISAKLNGLGIV